MSRVVTYTLATVATSLVAPSVAAAAPVATSEGPSSVRIAVSLLGLIVAIALLVEALGVRKVALGGVIAEKMSYVVLAIICLAASALAQWALNFVAGGVTLEQVQIASQVLVIVAMGLLAAYFFSVRRALQGYLSAMTGTEKLQRELSTDEPAEEEPRG